MFRENPMRKYEGKDENVCELTEFWRMCDLYFITSLAVVNLWEKRQTGVLSALDLFLCHRKDCRANDIFIQYAATSILKTFLKIELPCKYNTRV